MRMPACKSRLMRAHMHLHALCVHAVSHAEAGRHHGIPQVAVGAWEGLQGIQTSGAHSETTSSQTAPGLTAQLHTSGLGHQLPSAASLLQSQHLHGRDVPALDQAHYPSAAHHFGSAWGDGVAQGDALAPGRAAVGSSALMAPRCVPDADSSTTTGLLGPRSLKQQQGGRQQQQNQQQHGRRGGRAHSSSSVGLNKQIMTANSTAELLSLVRQHAAGFDFFNISTAIARVPKLVGPHGCGGQVRMRGEVIRVERGCRRPVCYSGWADATAWSRDSKGCSYIIFSPSAKFAS